MVCDFDFTKFYGKRGEGYIEVHLLTPVSKLEQKRKIDPEAEMTVLCANCHRMIHRRKDDVLALDELKTFIRST